MSVVTIQATVQPLPQQGYDWHVCIVSDQAAANLLPALDAALKPKKILLLCTQKMKQSSTCAHLEVSFKKSGISKCEIIMIDDERDINQMASVLDTWLKNHLQDRILINFTGGTKLMTLALYNSVLGNTHTALDVAYLDVDTQQLIFLQPDTKPRVGLTTKLSLAVYLESYGYTLQNHEVIASDNDRDHFCNWMLSQADKLAVELGEFNRACNEMDKARKNGGALNAEFEGGNEIVRQCVLNGWLQVLSGTLHRATSADALVFMQGGWLEYAVAHSIKLLESNGKLQDFAFNAQVMTDTHTKNELDCAFLARNRLHLIECKTRNLTGKDNTVAQEAFYKLDSLTKLGGLRTKGLFVSYRAVPDVVLQRAKDLNIKVIQRHQLATLSNQLSSWLAQ
jgi:hypothetical protein